MWLAPAALVLIVKRCFEPQASLLRAVDPVRRRCSGCDGSRCAFRSGGQRHLGSARCAARGQLSPSRRQVQRHIPEGEEVFKERRGADDAAIAKLGRTE